MYRTNIRDVPKVEGVKRDDGWVDLRMSLPDPHDYLGERVWGEVAARPPHARDNDS
jgi:hypothetical protein